MEPKVLEIFSDYIWPWCYFITGRVEQLRQEFDLQVIWRAFPLHPEIPEEGQTLEQLFAGRNFDIPAMLKRLKATADDLGLPFGERSMTFNSRRAQELGKWTEDQGKGNEFHMAAFKAYFAEGKNLAQMPVLRELAASVGLDPDESEQVLNSQQYKHAVDQDWLLSRQMGVSAVPTFVSDGKGLVGAQPYESLKRLVEGDSSLLG